MKAIYLEAIGKPFTLIEKEKPVAGPGEAIVQVKAAEIGRAHV